MINFECSCGNASFNILKNPSNNNIGQCVGDMIHPTAVKILEFECTECFERSMLIISNIDTVDEVYEIVRSDFFDNGGVESEEISEDIEGS